MPLHLLGKKSWNVYNPDNIARVQRDQAEAKARQVEEERRRQAAHSDSRLELLRGSEVPSSNNTPVHDDVGQGGRNFREHRNDPGEHVGGTLESIIRLRKDDSAPLFDKNGHINLFPGHGQPNKQSTRGNRQGQKEQIEGIRLADASGYGNQHGNAWYNTSAKDVQAGEGEIGRDVWGNEDPRRAQREQQRLNTNDPLAVMKRGVKQLKQAEAERADWKAQREKDLVEVVELASKHGRHSGHSRRRRSESSDVGSLEDFHLDESYREDGGRSAEAVSSDRRDLHRRRRHHHRHHHHRQRSKHGNRDTRRSRSPRREKS